VTAKLLTGITIFLALLMAGCSGPMSGNNRPVNFSGSNSSGSAVNKVSFIIPKSTAYKVLEWQDVMAKDDKKPATLREMAGKLEQIAKGAGKYTEIRIHGINGGFALVTALQKFRPADWIKTGDEEKATTAGNYEEYKDYLLKGKRSYYRFLIFSVTTDDNPESAETVISFEDAKKWVGSGAAAAKSTNPAFRDVLDVPLTEDYKITAHIYVFEKNESTNDPPSFQSGFRSEFNDYLNNLLAK
jgi:hypothetical protein